MRRLVPFSYPTLGHRRYHTHQIAALMHTICDVRQCSLHMTIFIYAMRLIDFVIDFWSIYGEEISLVISYFQVSIASSCKTLSGLIWFSSVSMQDAWVLLPLFFPPLFHDNWLLSLQTPSMIFVLWISGLLLISWLCPDFFPCA